MYIFPCIQIQNFYYIVFVFNCTYVRVYSCKLKNFINKKKKKEIAIVFFNNKILFSLLQKL